MRRLLSPFFLVLTALVAAGYAYSAVRLADGVAARLVLAVPFALVWVVPVVYWGLGRSRHSRADDLLHGAAYVAMGFLNFLLVALLARDAAQALAGVAGAAGLQAWLRANGSALALGVAVAALATGVLAARLGPRVKRVRVPIAGLDPRLEGLRIVQISDLHVGPTIGATYVRHVVERANSLDPHLVVLTGDIVDGPVARLRDDVAPLAGLRPHDRRWFVLGNHDVYSGARPWVDHFRALGIGVLLNEHVCLEHHGATVLLGGVTDPALGREGGPAPERAAGRRVPADLRILLAHNPKLAPLGERAGFDLQLSGHTHAGQFFPWTLAVRAVHAPHVAGLSRAGRMVVYVSAGTGSWGPPVRFGTRTELTLLELTAAR